MRWLKVPILVILLQGIIPYHTHSAWASQEHEIKVAFLYNFAKFTTWPNQTSDSFTICIAGRKFFESSQDKLSNKTINGKPIKVIDFSKNQGSACQILFISKHQKHQLKELIKHYKDKTTLTVSDIPSFAKQGGIIGLFIQSSKVKFEVNLDSVDRAKLQLSSQLLKLARIVK